jgi:thioredoxin reductase
VIIGGGVAGYVAAIKAGQAGLKVRRTVARHQTVR